MKKIILGLILGILIISIFLFYLIGYLSKDEQNLCFLKDIKEGEECSLYNSFKGYCERTGESDLAMHLSGCGCNQNRELICLDNIKNATQ